MRPPKTSLLARRSKTRDSFPDLGMTRGLLQLPSPFSTVYQGPVLSKTYSQ